MAKYAHPYVTFSGFVKAIRKLGNTTAMWDELNEEEQAEIIEISAQVSNSIGTLMQINPERWGQTKKP